MNLVRLRRSLEKLTWALPPERFAEADGTHCWTVTARTLPRARRRRPRMHRALTCDSSISSPSI